MDGANMNALVGIARPGDMGVDIRYDAPVDRLELRDGKVVNMIHACIEACHRDALVEAGVAAVATSPRQLASVIALAIELSQRAGCRYVTLDAKPHLVDWYRSLGFEINQLKQKQRLEASGTRNPDEIPVSMRFDLREV